MKSRSNRFIMEDQLELAALNIGIKNRKVGSPLGVPLFGTLRIPCRNYLSQRMKISADFFEFDDVISTLSCCIATY